ncbi:MAG: hypothetical protein IT204_11445 [Fimbriimonadaceae bacterium]|nr:hypothetical protein [Fimbriimonadaceae bacterium]
MPSRCLLVGLLSLAGLAAAVPEPRFYLPFEGTTTAAVAGGSPRPVRREVGQTDPALDYLAALADRFVEGPVGRGFDVGEQPLAYPLAGNFRPDEGTCACWVRPAWRGDNLNLYSTLFGAGDWGMVYKYLNQSSITFATAKPDRDLFYDCGGGDLRGWQPGQWHHLAVTWSRAAAARTLWIDGRPTARGPFGFHKPASSGNFQVGAGCVQYPDPVAHAAFDEFALWDQPLDAAALAEVYRRGQQGQRLWDGALPPPPGRVSAPPVGQSAVGPADSAPQVTAHGPRQVVDLSGWWRWRPSPDEATALPAGGWGRAKVPGYWTTPAETVAPDGLPARGRFGELPLSECGAACYQRDFRVDPAWRGQLVLLQLGGVDGLAWIYLNDHLLGLLPGWEPERYDLTPHLRDDRPNTLSIVLRTRGGSRAAGIYGAVELLVAPGPLLLDTTVQPRVATAEVEFTADLYAPQAGRLVWQLQASDDAGERRWEQPVSVAAAPASGPVSATAQRLTARLPWPAARRWSVEDPHLYQLRSSLAVGGRAVDALPPRRVGYRELRQVGGGFELNGVPFHLRGHQIDLAWPNQFARVQELRAAGLNGLELSGPIASEWSRGIPWQDDLYRRILNYCDEQGLVAAPLLPDSVLLRERIFEPAVNARFARRIEQFARTYGHHASIGLWYQHFNLAGYYWYLAPSKIDGRYRPDDANFAATERFALEAERLARQADGRAVYHHACGNFGSQITANIYLGPNTPTQEREEWLSGWSAQRTKPYLAVEHCCWLIPYWFRPRTFPLSVVYAGEPIFDELAAQQVGPDAYRSLTPELFELYDLDRAPRGSRTRALIARHPGYQAVKAEVARRSLRAWRTWEVPAVIFNAENWDFLDNAGRALPMQQALADYCGDLDLYLAGPGDDWPSKDHSFDAGESITKQVVLLNDLSVDRPLTLRWTVQTAAGQTIASGQLDAVAQAGRPTKVPLTFRAPAVTARTALTLRVTPSDARFRESSLALQVFPPAPPLRLPAGTLLYDPPGDTTRLLQAAHAVAAPLTAASVLTDVPLVLVGRGAWDASFEALARQLRLAEAVAAGTQVVVFEQRSGRPAGLTLTETSTRDAWPVDPTHPLLSGLAAVDWHDLRGASDVLPPYPDAPPESRRTWPARGFKWGNRGIVATYVYHRPQRIPFVALLSCGFDLNQSPLLEAVHGRGRVTLCQVDLTNRYGRDPVSTRLLQNLLAPRPPATTQPVRPLGPLAAELVQRYGLQTAADAGLWLVSPDAAAAGSLEGAASAGSTVLLLPGWSTPLAGLQQSAARWFQASPTATPWPGLSGGELFVKAWTSTAAAQPAGGWTVHLQPGLLASKPLGAGRLALCQVPLAATNPRAAAKLQRTWNLVLSGLHAARAGDPLLPAAPEPAPVEGETLPPYIDW